MINLSKVLPRQFRRLIYLVNIFDPFFPRNCSVEIGTEFDYYVTKMMAPGLAQIIKILKMLTCQPKGINILSHFKKNCPPC